ncbi:MAG TPA: 3'-5' exonuclease [Thermoanaerobaculia bacterium]|nr:3'-5' exonuclease [Thermoanaerobaculia bacterium]
MLFRSPARDAAVWALDLETSGLSPRRGEILSVGMVPIRAGTIRWGERFYSLVRPADPAHLSPAGVEAHHLLPADLTAAPPLCAVLAEVDQRLREGTLLLHHAHLDLGFLRRAYRQCRLSWPRPPVVDTVDLLLRYERWRPPPKTRPPTAPAGSLSAARHALGLPPHDAHHALADALATAELYLALQAKGQGRR